MKRCAWGAGGAVLVLAVVPAAGQGVGHEVKKLAASDAAADDWFGRTVSLSGDTGVVAAHYDDDAGDESGSAYVFQRDWGGADNWGEVVKLTASDAAAEDYFADSVAISLDTIVAGASLDDDLGATSGSAYVFERDHGGVDNWGERTKLTASDGAADDRFGYAVAIADDTIVVGSFQDDDAGAESGSAYVFERDAGGGTWSEVAKLVADDAAASDQFGIHVAISGDTVVVGAHQDDDGGLDAGAAYVFQRDWGGRGNWGQVAKLVADDAGAGDWYGWRVAIAGDTVIVGSVYDDDLGVDSGAAYVYQRHEGGAHNWGQVAKLRASDGAGMEGFGFSVSTTGDAIAVGVFLGNDGATNPGAVYVYDRHAGGVSTWGEVTKLLAADGAHTDRFGVSTSLSGDTLLIGAYGDDDDGDGSGSAYVFELSGSATAYCFGDGSGTPCPCSNPGSPGRGCANGTFPGGCLLDFSGSASVRADTVLLRAIHSTPFQPGLFFQGNNAVNGGAGVTFGDGLRCAGGRVVRLEIATASPGGTAATTIAIARKGGVLPGDIKRYQWWYRDPAASPCGSGYNLSNAVEVAWAP